MQNFIIAINGKLGSGKDSFADFAVKYYNYKKLFFAEPLKLEVKSFLQKYELPFEDKNIWGSQEEKEEKLYIQNINEICKSFSPFVDFRDKVINGQTTYRYLLQWWGTDYRRVMCDNDYWTKKFIEEASKYEKVVCSDLRFVNEYETIISNNGICIKVIRDNNFKSDTALHISETALDHIEDWYCTLNNNSTLEDYYTTCDLLLKDIEERYLLLGNWRA